MNRRVNDSQFAVLRWVADGCPPGQEPSECYKQSALALANRRLVQVSKKKGQWQATLTDAGRHFVDNGDYPPAHFLAREPEPTPTTATETSAGEAPVGEVPKHHGALSKHVRSTVADKTPEVDSPAGVRRRGQQPKGDGLRGTATDPWDERILITVKEAAWLLSVPEGAIRQAVTLGDVDRVFIGAGTKNYRVIYGSLLAWVNSMPRDSARQRWWY